MTVTLCDFIVVGGGIAGASAAFELASLGKVVVLEQEDAPGYHSTGRSAAILLDTYGSAAVRGLTRASRPFLEDPPPGFTETPLVGPRGAVFIADEPSLPLLREHHEAVCRLVTTAQWLSESQLSERCPCLVPGVWAAGVFEPDALDLDVNAIHQGYLRQLKQKGGVVHTRAEVSDMKRTGSVWTVQTAAGVFQAPHVINAAGAWGDVIATRAGVAPIGLSALRRTAVTIEAPPDSAHWPYIEDIAETFYFKPDAGRILASPCDQTDVGPSDARPQDLDVAIIADRVERATNIVVKRIVSRWAGLRTFSPDRTPVAGFADDVEGFFWLVGQGGYGIQTAPAMAAACRGLVTEGRLPAHLAALGVTAAELTPARFAKKS